MSTPKIENIPEDGDKITQWTVFKISFYVM